MKLIFDNIIFSLQKSGGISVVWQHLIAGLSHRGLMPECLEYKGADENISRQRLDIPSDRIINMGPFRFLRCQFSSPRVKSDTPFIFHSSYFRTCRSKGAVNVTTVHDFTYSKIKVTLRQRCRRWLSFRAIRRSDAIVCVSENTRNELLRFLPDIDPAKVHVIHNGVSETFHAIEGGAPYPEYSSHVLFVGGRQAYKNFEFAVRELAPTRFSLLIVGAPLDNCEKALLEALLPGRYKAFSYPSNEELNRLYNSVHCLVYPSSNEGFGLPVAEACKAGCPVVASKNSSIPEVLGDSRLMMDRCTGECLRDHLEMAGDKDIRAEVIARQKDHVERFTWQKMADQYLSLYQKLLKFA